MELLDASLGSSLSEYAPRKAWKDLDYSGRSLCGATADFGFNEDDILESFGAVKLQSAPISDIAKVPGVQPLKILGKGSYSEVWECYVAGKGGTVAVKVFHEGATVSDSNEVRALKMVEHPNIVRLLALVEGPPSALFLHVCAGGTVHSFLHGASARALHFSVEQRLKPASEIALALSYLHASEILHRDVKATNVLFDEWLREDYIPTAKLGDLGLARLDAAATQKTQGVGSVLYIAPENMTSTEYGKPADVYSFAVLCNEMVLAEKPYLDQVTGKQSNMAQITCFVIRGGRPRLCQDPQIAHAVQSSWDADPQRRWLASDLATYLQQKVLAVKDGGYHY
jgi:serine/threonine protein kinase